MSVSQCSLCYIPCLSPSVSSDWVQLTWNPEEISSIDDGSMNEWFACLCCIRSWKGKSWWKERRSEWSRRVPVHLSPAVLKTRVKLRAKSKQRKKARRWTYLLVIYCLFVFGKLLLLACVYLCILCVCPCSVLSLLLMLGLMCVYFCFSLLKSLVSVCVCMLVCAVCVSDWPHSSVRVLVLWRCLSRVLSSLTW